MMRFGGEFSSDFSLPGSESQRGLDLLEERFPARAGAEADLLFKDERGITSPEVRAVAERTINELKANPNVAEIESPFDNPMFISQDGTIARESCASPAPRTTLAFPRRRKSFIVDANNGRIRHRRNRGHAFFNEQPIWLRDVRMLAAIVILLIAFGSVGDGLADRCRVSAFSAS
jgi:RND superfamily putative drug exporter